jgi:hypothetical protein
MGRHDIERHGKPSAFYSDKASVFRNTNAGKTGNRVTHFGRAMLRTEHRRLLREQLMPRNRNSFTSRSCRVRCARSTRPLAVAEANAYAPAFYARVASK